MFSRTISPQIYDLIYNSGKARVCLFCGDGVIKNIPFPFSITARHSVYSFSVILFALSHYSHISSHTFITIDLLVMNNTKIIILNIKIIT